MNDEANLEHKTDGVEAQTLQVLIRIFNRDKGSFFKAVVTEIILFFRLTGSLWENGTKFN